MRQRAATLIQQAWSGGYKRACEVGGAVFVPMALTPYGGWHKDGKDSAEESWTRRTTHTGDKVGFYEFDQRFEHPGRTWASATHRAFSFACVGAAMANETWKFVQTKSKHAMKQVLGIKNEAARMKVTPPLAVAPHVHGDDMRWNPNDDGINFNPEGRCAPEHHYKRCPATPLKNQRLINIRALQRLILTVICAFPV